MFLKDIKNYISCNVLCGEEFLDREINDCFSADLMSDVLRFARTGSLLLTGLANTQVIQVAEIMDLKAIVFVRGKEPNETVIQEANRLKLPLLSTEMLMFDCCGILYAKGLRGGKSRLEDKNESGTNIQSVV